MVWRSYQSSAEGVGVALRAKVQRARLRDWVSTGGRIIVHLIHAWGGGVAVHARDLARRQSEVGGRSILLQIVSPSSVQLILPPELGELVFNLGDPNDLATMREVFARSHPVTLHVHNVIGLTAKALDSLLGCFNDRVITFHDFYFICPQVTLTNHLGKPCHVRPANVCERCVAASRPLAPLMSSVASQRVRLKKIALESRRLFAPSNSAGELLARHLGAPVEVVPHLEAGTVSAPRVLQKGDERIVVTIGNPKGADMLAKVIQDADRRSLPLRFVLAGIGSWPNPLKNTTILPPYQHANVHDVLVGIGGHLAFLSSIVAETYMYALSECVCAGYFPVVFDLGAQAERVRELGWGMAIQLDTSAVEIADLLANVELVPPEPGAVAKWLEQHRRGPMDYYD